MLGVPAIDLDLDDFQAAGEFKSSSAPSFAFSRGNTSAMSRGDRSRSPGRHLNYGSLGGGGGYSGGFFDGSGSEEKEREPMMVSEEALLADLRTAEAVLGGGGGGGNSGGMRDNDAMSVSPQVTSVDEQGVGQGQGQGQAFFGTAMTGVDE